jgi:hypothetical protein
MLGDLIAEENIKIVGRRVLSVKDGIPEIETSTKGRGNYKGTDYQQTSTFYTIPRSEDGKIFYVEGKGTITTNDGEMATYSGQAVGKQIEPASGSMRFYGSLFYRTSSKNGKLASLSNLVGVFETVVDDSNNALAKIWEWK